MSEPMKVLIFGAKWCGSCQVLKNQLKDESFPGFEIEEVDADANAHLADKYGVRGLPTIVVPALGISQPTIVSKTQLRRFLDGLR